MADQRVFVKLDKDNNVIAVFRTNDKSSSIVGMEDFKEISQKHSKHVISVGMGKMEYTDKNNFTIKLKTDQEKMNENIKKSAIDKSKI